METIRGIFSDLEIIVIPESQFEEGIVIGLIVWGFHPETDRSLRSRKRGVGCIEPDSLTTAPFAWRRKDGSGSVIVTGPVIGRDVLYHRTASLSQDTYIIKVRHKDQSAIVIGIGRAIHGIIESIYGHLAFNDSHIISIDGRSVGRRASGKYQSAWSHESRTIHFSYASITIKDISGHDSLSRFETAGKGSDIGVVWKRIIYSGEQFEYLSRSIIGDLTIDFSSVTIAIGISSALYSQIVIWRVLGF